MTKPLRLLLAAALLLGFQATAHAQGAAKKEQAQLLQLAAQQGVTPALWVVRDADTEIYVFGTSHLLPEGINWLNGSVRQAFEASDTLVLEMVQPDNPAELQPIIVRLGFNPPGVTLTSQLPPELRGRLAATTGQLGLPMAALEPLQPWLAATTIAVTGLQSIGMNPAHGVEAVLKKHAAQRGVSIVGLETPEQQFGFLASLPAEEQVALLKASIEDLQGLRQESTALMTHWMRGDIEAVGELMNDSLKHSPRLSKVLLADRNAKWAVWVSERMKKPGRVFLAVGAGHLAGSDSLFTMLAKHGITAKRIPNRPANDNR